MSSLCWFYNLIPPEFQATVRFASIQQAFLQVYCSPGENKLIKCVLTLLTNMETAFAVCWKLLTGLYKC